MFNLIDEITKWRSFRNLDGENFRVLLSLIQIAAVEGKVVQESNTKFGKEYKVDWKIPNTESVEMRTIWEISSESGNPRLISAFLKREK